MKNCFFYLLAFIFNLPLIAQNEYRDALLLKRYSNYDTDGKVITISPVHTKDTTKFALERDSILSVLAAYFPGVNTTTDQSDFRGLVAENPFFSREFTLAGMTMGAGTKPKVSNGIGASIAAIGGLDVTSLADGIANFLVKRTKEELNVSFFSKFREELSQDKYKDLQTLFPQTCKAMNALGDQIYNYGSYIQTLRECFQNDLDQLATHLPSIIENNRAFFNKFPELEATLKSGCYIASELQQNIHPGEILQDYPADYLDSLNKNWKGAIQTLQLVSGSLRDTCTACPRYWVSSKQIKILVNDSIAFKIYLGLLYQDAKLRYEGVPFRDISLLAVLDSVAPHFKRSYPAYKNYFLHFAEKADKLNAMIANHKTAKNDSLKTEQYSAYYNASLDLLEYCAQAGKLVPAVLAKGKLTYFNYLPDSLKDYFDVARSASALVLDLNRKNYAAAIVNTVHIYSLVIDQHFISEKTFTEAKDSIRKMAGEAHIEFFSKNPVGADTILSAAQLKQVRPYADAVYNYTKTKGIPDNAAATVQKLFRYGTFMATVVLAQSSDEVADAIEAFALPTGSARIKRESYFNVSLNAYCGLFAGLERQQFVYRENTPAINSFGVTAPIGMAINWGSRKFLRPWNKNGHSSHSIFLSVIDVGAIASFRFENDTIKTLSKIELKDILSPGLFYSFGIPKTPLSVNLGYQVTPFLRSVSTTDNTFRNSYQRFSVSLLVDIPVLNFHTKTRD